MEAGYEEEEDEDRPFRKGKKIRRAAAQAAKKGAAKAGSKRKHSAREEDAARVRKLLGSA